MAEELQESEVIFSENATGNEADHHWYNHRHHHSDSGESQSNTTLKRKDKERSRNSVPVNIPAENFSGSSWIQYVESDCSDEFHYDDGEIVPPHEIVGRRVARKMAFSVCSGNGRTLKGRDLSQVRNLILRMTGFLEA